MSTEFFIAKRLYFEKKGEKSVSPPAIRVATISMALGLVVMILAVAIVVGFKKEVRNKVIGFGSHIQISNFDSNTSYETQPIVVDDSLYNALQAYPNVAHVERFATKSGIMKTDDDFLGVVLKGVDEDYNWDFFQQYLLEGEVLSVSADSTSTDVMISRHIADKLNLSLHDAFRCYFVQADMGLRARRFTIKGIYETNFSDYDKLFVVADIKQIRRLNGWSEDQSSGLEILVKDYDRLDETTENLFYELMSEKDGRGNHYFVRSIKQINPAIFGWLDYLDTNVVVILALMLIVAGFSMISGLLIIILERTNMIGILKALGQSNGSIRKIFLYISTFLIGKGLLWGNVIALFICFVQKQFGLLKLDSSIYYLSEVPIDINLFSILLINIGTLIVTLLMLLGPSFIIAKISPAKTIRFE